MWRRLLRTFVARAPGECCARVGRAHFSMTDMEKWLGAEFGRDGAKPLRGEMFKMRLAMKLQSHSHPYAATYAMRSQARWQKSGIRGEGQFEEVAYIRTRWRCGRPRCETPLHIGSCCRKASRWPAGLAPRRCTPRASPPLSACGCRSTDHDDIAPRLSDDDVADALLVLPLPDRTRPVAQAGTGQSEASRGGGRGRRVWDGAESRRV